ncbi:penicillin-binding transpeptidase domain-containing protein [Kitasatospora aburaviensis]
MALSVNTYFVQMEQEIGLCAVKQMANKLGIATTASGDPLRELPAMGLGTQEVSPLVMANVYATFAARGTYCAPVAISKISTVDGRDVPVTPVKCNQAIAQTTADVINTVLLGVTEKGTARDLDLDDGRQIAAKTGTADEKKAAWFSGYTANLAASVWLGGPAKGVPMKDIRIGGKYYDEVFGATGPGPIWRLGMNQAVKDMPEETFPTVYIPDPPKREPTPAPARAAAPGHRPSGRAPTAPRPRRVGPAAAASPTPGPATRAARRPPAAARTTRADVRSPPAPALAPARAADSRAPDRPTVRGTAGSVAGKVS